MELPTIAVFVPLYLMGRSAFDLAPLALLALWLSHYLHRTFIFPFRLKLDGKRVAVFIVLMSVLFNTLNAYIISLQLSHFGSYSIAWLTGPRFLLGTLLFAIGYAINRHADRTLIRLRAPGETGYKIPRGGLYEHISCPNYFGEIIEWTGFAIATWSLPGLAFALYTAANVGPRALSHHRWYREKFEDYPRERKALIPFVL
jgi:steroid 5-alpha-reductase/3-oxo-5-alpha-steroid 4-dehydrogenase 1